LPIKRLSIEEFISLSESIPVFDVRSPGEFSHAHFPKAISLPLFTDEERKEVGTAYKQKGKQEAIKIGLDYFGPKMNPIISTVAQEHRNAPAEVLLYCWRGGMRSGGVAWLLDLYGYQVYVLNGGYKAYRNWALSVFQKPYQIRVLGGYTGSAKTLILNELNKHQPVIDLEGIAHHKGSAFGGINQPQQPTQEMFENILALQLSRQKNAFWVEDESQRIGKLNIPNALWETMRNSPVYFIDVPFEERLNHIVEGYGHLDVDKMIEAVLRIQKRFGPLETKTTVAHFEEGKIREAFSILLKYYDKQYAKSLQNRTNLDTLLHKIPLQNIDIVHNTNMLLNASKNDS
jgi:tRNA 2-selenouridine synthase